METPAVTDAPTLLAELDALAEKATPTDHYRALWRDEASYHHALANAYPLLRAEILRLREALEKIAGGFWSTASVDALLNAGNWQPIAAEAQKIARAALKGSEGGE